MFSNDEKEYLKKLVKKNLESFQEEEKTILDNMTPAFIKSEQEYEDFLKEIIKKLE